MKEFIIEIATTDFQTTREAVKAGADRIELCASLAEGGITPSFGTIKNCREFFNLSLFPMIRPRPGDFLYSDEEFDIMVDDVRSCKSLDCDGIVFGLLLKDGSIDVKRTSRLVDEAYPLEITFHRAFDRCKEPYEAMEQLIQIGVHRILTSGQQPTAILGIELISGLVKAADHRIIIMPGSGVRKNNIKELALMSGTTEFHTSLRSSKDSEMIFIHPSFASSQESYTNPSINKNEVSLMRSELEELH